MASETPVSQHRSQRTTHRKSRHRGTITADQVIVTVPTALLAERSNLFSPGAAGQDASRAGLPLGLADKLFIALADAEEFEPNSRVFDIPTVRRPPRYQIRPLGRPMIEAYFGGSHAAALEAEGDARLLRLRGVGTDGPVRQWLSRAA